MNRIKNLLIALHTWATEYEPAVAASIAAAVFQMLAGLGIAVGDLPAKVDAVLGFVAVAATLIAGRQIRKRVFSPYGHKVRVQAAALKRLGMER